MGALLPSREVRWFIESTNENSTILKKWIEDKDPYDEKGQFPGKGIWKKDDREDKYVVVPGSTDMGIKWREGQLQIKGRSEDAGMQVFNGRMQGRVEQWLKWSYEGADIANAFLPWFKGKLDKGPTIIPVKKTRALRKIRIDGREVATEVNDYPDRAVNVELTNLEVFGKRYWSIGFEAFPDDSNMSSAFSQVAEKFLSTLRGVELSPQNCYSYPSWLSTL